MSGEMSSVVATIQSLVTVTGDFVVYRDLRMDQIVLKLADSGKKLLGAWSGRVVLIVGDQKVAAQFKENGNSVIYVYRKDALDDRIFDLNPTYLSGPCNKFLSRGIGYQDWLAEKKGIAGLVEFVKNPKGADPFPPGTGHVVEMLCKIVEAILVAWLPEANHAQSLIEIPQAMTGQSFYPATIGEGASA